MALKLRSTQRHPHVMSAVLDEGLALFAGLNVVPKRSFLTEYSCRINCDVQLTLMASSLDRYLGQHIGNGYQTVKSSHLFRDFIDASATIEINERAVWVHFQKRTHHPLLVAEDFQKTDIRIPRLGGKRLFFQFG